jgi:hypothetical protein
MGRRSLPKVRTSKSFFLLGREMRASRRPWCGRGVAISHKACRRSVSRWSRDRGSVRSRDCSHLRLRSHRGGSPVFGLRSLVRWYVRPMTGRPRINRRGAAPPPARATRTRLRPILELPLDSLDEVAGWSDRLGAAPSHRSWPGTVCQLVIRSVPVLACGSSTCGVDSFQRRDR